MNQSLQRSLSHLTGSEDIEAASHEQLEKLSDQYPYFAIPKILLAKKLKATNGGRFLPHVQKTALYFNNPQWLHFQLLNDVPGIVVHAKEKEQTAIINNEDAKETLVEAPRNAVLHNVSKMELESASTLAKNTLATNQAEQANVVENNFTATPPLQEDKSADEEIAEEILATTSDEVTIAEPVDEVLPEENEEEPTPVPDQFHPEPEFIAEELQEEQLIQASPEQTTEEIERTRDAHEQLLEEVSPLENAEKIANDEDNIDEPVLALDEAVVSDNELEHITDEIPKPVSVSEEELAEDEVLLNEITHHTEHVEETAKVEEESEIHLKEDDKQSPETNDDDDKITISLDDHDVFQRAMKEKNQTLSSGFGSSASNSQDLIPIEPYHTIDYFASQGIKLELEKNPKDKLGKNLRSFTDWLKHMKKLGPEDAIDTIKNQHQESIIQGIADTSNIQRDIVTETMAEVLEKQGKKEKAIQLYIKLSFLNTDKSAYFADKIQKLKGI